MCKESNCKKRPNYNFINETIGLYCFTHKIENMVDIKSKKCIDSTCNKLPIFNFIGETKGL